MYPYFAPNSQPLTNAFFMIGYCPTCKSYSDNEIYSIKLFYSPNTKKKEVNILYICYID